jgi:hypothetical protein
MAVDVEFPTYRGIYCMMSNPSGLPILLPCGLTSTGALHTIIYMLTHKSRCKHEITAM